MPPNNLKLAEAIVAAATSLKVKIAFAESCTGGALAYAITSVPGASHVLEGSVVVYSDQAKMSLLYVDGYTLGKQGAVSDRVAELMVEGLFQSFEGRIDIALATTGFLQHEDRDERLAYVCLGVRDPELDETIFSKLKIPFFCNEREVNRQDVVERALMMLYERLSTFKERA